MGECGKCGLRQKVGCNKSVAVKMMVQSTDERKVRKNVSMFNDMIRAVCGASNCDRLDIETRLLTLPCKKFMINQNVVIGLKDVEVD